jgi:hypothetical protein
LFSFIIAIYPGEILIFLVKDKSNVYLTETSFYGLTAVLKKDETGISGTYGLPGRKPVAYFCVNNKNACRSHNRELGSKAPDAL